MTTQYLARTAALLSVLLLSASTALAVTQPNAEAADAGVQETISDLDPVAAPDTPDADDEILDIGVPDKDSCDCGKPACTCEKLKALKKAVAASHKNVFYDNKFGYLSDPCYCDWHLGDNMKRLNVVDWITVDVGGQYRMRQQSERNIRATEDVTNLLGLTGEDDDFLLHRTRLYVNTEIGKRVRVYAEMLDAVSNFESLNPRGIEENRYEMQNLFGDFVLMDDCCSSLTFRVGRQELQYGAQRLVSPLDWANTRRTFEGAKLMWRGQKWDIDAFWTRPMRPNASGLDSPHQDRELYGIYSTYKGWCQDKADVYWLALDFEDVGAQGFRYDTIGTRYYGSRDAWLYELEAAYQFGTNSDGSDHSAGAFTLGLGRKFENICWKPTLWGYYDWASGDNTVGNGYHHYLPLAHKYNGFMDLFGRRNLQDANLLLTMQPHCKLKLLAWYHYFRLQDGDDVPYNVNMSAFADLPANSSGSKDLGHELDLIADFVLTPRIDLLLGYSHFFAGDYYATSPVPFDGDADFFYTQLQVNF